MKADSEEFREAVRAIFADSTPAKIQTVVNLVRQCEESSYLAGVEMTRKLVRLRLGLSTKEDEAQ